MKHGSNILLLFFFCATMTGAQNEDNVLNYVQKQTRQLDDFVKMFREIYTFGKKYAEEYYNQENSVLDNLILDYESVTLTILATSISFSLNKMRDDALFLVKSVSISCGFNVATSKDYHKFANTSQANSSVKFSVNWRLLYYNRMFLRTVERSLEVIKNVKILKTEFEKIAEKLCDLRDEFVKQVDKSLHETEKMVRSDGLQVGVPVDFLGRVWWTNSSNVDRARMAKRALDDKKNVTINYFNITLGFVDELIRQVTALQEIVDHKNIDLKAMKETVDSKNAELREAVENQVLQPNGTNPDLFITKLNAAVDFISHISEIHIQGTEPKRDDEGAGADADVADLE